MEMKSKRKKKQISNQIRSPPTDIQNSVIANNYNHNKEFEKVKDDTLDKSTEVESRISLQIDEIKLKYASKLTLIIIAGFFTSVLLEILCSAWNIKVGERTIIEYYASFVLPVLTLMIGIDVGRQDIKKNEK